MKKAFLIGLLLSINIFAFSVDFRVSYYDVIRITDNKLYYYGFEDEDEEYDITWEKENNLEYITFNYTGKFLDDYSQFRYKREIVKGTKRYLILYGGQGTEDGHGDFLFLYDNNNELVYAKYSRLAVEVFFENETAITATSEFTEGDIIYSAKNLLDIGKISPWAESVNGSGIGEKIFMEYDRIRGGLDNDYISKWRISGIAISNGFVDYKRPYLYGNNNRIKKIRVHFVDLNDFIDFDLEDTSQLQYFHFGIESAKIEIEILNVYKGDRWDDTCINMILPYANAWG